MDRDALKPSRTHMSNCTFVLPGGTKDNDLWVHQLETNEGRRVHGSVWVPTDEQRARIASGENIELLIWGGIHPPVAVCVTDVPLGKKPEAS